MISRTDNRLMTLAVFGVIVLAWPAHADVLVAGWRGTELRNAASPQSLAAGDSGYYPMDRAQPAEETLPGPVPTINALIVLAVSGIVPFTATPGEEETGEVTSTPNGDPDIPENTGTPPGPTPPLNHAPEPGSLALAALGGGCLALLGRRRRNPRDGDG